MGGGGSKASGDRERRVRGERAGEEVTLQKGVTSFWKDVHGKRQEWGFPTSKEAPWMSRGVNAWFLCSGI